MSKNFLQIEKSKVVGQTGLEPVTPRLSSVCSNQLSYRPINLILEGNIIGGGTGI